MTEEKNNGIILFMNDMVSHRRYANANTSQTLKYIKNPHISPPKVFFSSLLS